MRKLSIFLSVLMVAILATAPLVQAQDEEVQVASPAVGEGFNLKFSNYDDSLVLRSIGSHWTWANGIIQTIQAWDVFPQSYWSFVYFNPPDTTSTRQFTNFTFEARVQALEAVQLLFRAKIDEQGGISKADSIVVEAPGYVNISSLGKSCKIFNSEPAVRRDWNTIRVLAKKRKLKVWINGKQIWSGKCSRTRAGYAGVGVSAYISSGDERAIIDSMSLQPR